MQQDQNHTPNFDPAEIAETIADALERDCTFPFVDWSDQGEVTIQIGGRTFRASIADITDEGE